MNRDYYQSTAASYDSKWKHYTTTTLTKLLEYLPPSLADKHVLDWGCGTGELIRRLLIQHPDVAQIIGYDPVEEMLTQAKGKIRALDAPLQQKVKLQSQQHFHTKFDLIVSSSVLHYLPQPEASLQQFHSLLQEKGTLLLLDYTKNGLLVKFFEWAFKLIDAMHQQAYTGMQIKKMVEKSGFTTRQEEAFTISPLWKGYIIRASVAK